MSHSIDEARTELAEALEQGRRPEAWAMELAAESLAAVSEVEVSEADLDAVCDAVFGTVSEAASPGRPVDREAGDELAALDEAVFGSAEGER